MTALRAQEILKDQHPVWGLKYNFENEFNRYPADGVLGSGGVISERLCERGITREEDTYIRDIWELIGPSASYYDAVCKIAEG